MKHTSTDNTLQAFAVVAIGAGLLFFMYWWFTQQPRQLLAPEGAVEEVSIEERSAPVEDESDLNAARSELDSTNLGQIDVELQDLNVQVNY